MMRAALLVSVLLGVSSACSSTPSPASTSPEPTPPAPVPAEASAPASPAPTTPPNSTSIVRVLPVSYGVNSSVREQVKRECAPDAKLRASLLQAAGARAVAVDAIEPVGEFLAVEIASTDARGGGIYTGPKEMFVRGTLTRDGQVIGSFQAKRTTMGGPTAPFRGTCDLLDRIAQRLGQDIAQWLASPSQNARLGEL